MAPPGHPGGAFLIGRQAEPDRATWAGVIAGLSRRCPRTVGGRGVIAVPVRPSGSLATRQRPRPPAEPPLVEAYARTEEWSVMTPSIELLWPTSADERLRAGVHRVIHAVVELGGAVGWLAPPGRTETDAWLDQILDAVNSGEASLALAVVDGEVAATGLWRRGASTIFRHSAELQKVMAHPAARGLGLGRLLVSALISDARTTGIEVLTLGVRGNNHGAIELYERLGFREWGRLPNVIEVGDYRFDDVKMFVDLGRPPHVTLRGSLPGGSGSSGRRQDVRSS